MTICAGPAGAASNDDLRKQLEDSKNNISPFPRAGLNDPKLKEALGALAKALEDVDCTLFPSGAADCFVTIVTDALTKFQTAFPRKTLSNAQVAAIRAALAPLVPPQDPPSPPLLIKIHRAFYGDLQFIRAHMAQLDSKYPVQPQGQYTAFHPYAVLNRNEPPEFFDTKRMCSASQSVRALCHGQPTCLTDATLNRTGVQLCGYEPAPYAEPMHRGLVVEYDCQPEVDASTPPPPPPLPLPSPTKIVQIRAGETARIFCSEASQ